MSQTLTPLGKVLRKLRIDSGMLLKEMAECMGLTPAFLSSVETGRKAVPSNFLDRLLRATSIDDAVKEEITRAIELSAREFKLSLSAKPSEVEREVAACLARSFSKLTDEDMQEIKNIVDRRHA